ncbi:unnamed protein product [marine sediment metagenome]|uniref:Uncharacterized protein n=1 Tax=marine sediment metagenome TaxID=412755 RepID=X1C935_9ZZZZ
MKSSIIVSAKSFSAVGGKKIKKMLMIIRQYVKSGFHDLFIYDKFDLKIINNYCI